MDILKEVRTMNKDIKTVTIDELNEIRKTLKNNTMLEIIFPGEEAVRPSSPEKLKEGESDG